METIHIDKYDADARTTTEPAVPPVAWTERMRHGGAELGRNVASVAGKVVDFVKRKPGATAVAALGVGLFAAPGKHRLLKAAYGAVALPYLRRQLADLQPS